MKAAIYSRKSKFTEKGDSIANQIQLCREYALSRFNLPDADIKVFEDEGFSGGTTDRPQFQLMLKEIKAKKLDMLICYRLDRVSRNIADFSQLMEELQKYNISFISIREQFDTTSPMGRAMLYIASVFAQLERETIAERIRDNMLQLAKTGRWLGGTTPTGYASEQIVFIDPSGKERKMFKLIPVPDELEIIQLIFDKYLELKSITKLEQYFVINNIQTKNNVDFKRHGLRFILTNPVYVVADKPMYDYLTENGYEIYCSENDFTGKHGIMAYNKTNQVKSGEKSREITEWIVAIGVHEGIIESEKWIKVQNLLLKNKSKSYRKVKNSTCLLSGLLRCGNCGGFMRPKIMSGRITEDGLTMFYYMCEMKEKSKKTRCDIKNVNGIDLDRLVINEIKSISLNNSSIHKNIDSTKISIQTSQNSILNEITLLESNIKSNEQAISNLVSSLSQGENSSAAKYIIAQINNLDQQNVQAKERLLKFKEIEEINQSKEGSLDVVKDMLAAFTNSIDIIDIEAKRLFIRSIVEKIIWNGENIELIMFGANSLKN